MAASLRRGRLFARSRTGTWGRTWGRAGVRVLAGAILGALAVPAIGMGFAASALGDEEPVSIEGRLAASPVLQKLALQKLGTFGPFVLLVQRPQAGAPNTIGKAAQFYGPWLDALAQSVAAEYARPAKLERRSAGESQALVLLTAAQDFHEYFEGRTGLGLYAGRAHFDPVVGMVLALENPKHRPPADHAHRRPVLHEAVLALLHDYDRSEGGALFARVGVAQYLSYHLLNDPSALAKRDIDRDALKLYTVLRQHSQLAGTYSFPIEQLAGLRDYREAYEACRQRVSEGGGMMPARDWMLAALHAQAGLWMHFLHHGADGKRADAVRAYVGEVLGGMAADAAWKKTVGEENGKTLEREFEEYVATKFAEQSLTVPLDRKGAEELFALSGERLEVLALAREPFGMEDLAPGADDPDTRFALALGRALEGDLAAAIETMGELAGSTLSGEGGAIGERAARERERLVAMEDARKRFLEHLATIGRKLNLELGEDRLLAEIERVEDGFVHLGSNRLGMEKLELARIDLLQLQDMMSDPKADFEAGWLAAYPLVLAGRSDEAERALRGAHGDGAELASLRRDAQEDYPARLAVARAATRLDDLSKRSAPRTAEEARALLAGIAELMQESGDLSLVRKHNDDLVRIVSRAAAMDFDSSGMDGVLCTTWKDQGGGKVQVTYDFTKERERAAFLRATYLEGMREGRPDVGKPASVTVDKGALVLDGPVCVRHAVEMEAPVTVRYEIAYRLPKPNPRKREPPPKDLLFSLGICDDGFENYASCTGFGGLTVVDKPGSFVQTAGDSAVAPQHDKSYKLEIVHDGSRIRALLDGKEQAVVDAGPRQRGSVFLWAHTDVPIEIRKLELEGGLVQDSVSEFKARSIESKLVEVGLR